MRNHTHNKMTGIAAVCLLCLSGAVTAQTTSDRAALGHSAAAR